MERHPASSKNQRAPAKAPRQRYQAEERRSQIIQSAIKLADQVGLDRITVGAVAKDIGVAPGLIHHYFPTTDELIVETLKVHAAERRQLIEGRLSAHPPLPALCIYVVEMTGISRTSARIWLSAWMTEARRADLSHELTQQDDLDISLLEALLHRGLKAGVFRLPDTRAAALRIITVLDGVLVRVSRRLDPDFSDQIESLVWSVVEREVGFDVGTLHPDLDAPAQKLLSTS